MPHPAKAFFLWVRCRASASMGVSRNENAAARLYRDTQKQEKCYKPRSTQEILSAGHDLERCLCVLPGGLFAELDGELHPVTVGHGHQPVLHHGQDCFGGFCFRITHSKTEAGQTAAGTFTFAGSLCEAEKMLIAAGFRKRRGTHAGKLEFRTRGSWLTGANSAHFLLAELKEQKTAGETQGEFHFGEHNPYSPFGWLLHWLFEAHR